MYAKAMITYSIGPPFSIVSSLNIVQTCAVVIKDMFTAPNDQQ